jgi:hypothetical protein
MQAFLILCGKLATLVEGPTLTDRRDHRRRDQWPIAG